MTTVEYRIGIIKNNYPETESNIDFKEELDIDVFHELNDALLYLDKLKMLFNLFDFIELHCSDFHFELENSIKLYIEKIDYWNGFTNDDLEKIHINLNRLFLNYLSSYKSLIDYAETTINREFGKESSQYKEFKGLLSELFDNEFSYRFFYKLRNYSQHIGLPIHNISFGHEVNIEESEYVANIKLSLDTQRLLNEFKDWGKVKSDLENCASEIELIKVLNDNLKTCRKIKEVLFKVYKVEINNRIELIERVSIHHKDENTEVFVGTLTIHSDEKMTLNHRKILFCNFDWWKANIESSSDNTAPASASVS